MNLSLRATILTLLLLATAAQAQSTPADIFARAAPATVVVVALRGSEVSLGTGTIVSPAGQVVTNHHVIEIALRGGQLFAFLYDPTERIAEEDFARYLETHRDRARPLRVLGTDPANDLAMLALPGGTPYPSFELGNSETIRVGESVLAIGTPHGLTWSLTPGLISALRPNAIQTSTPINPGNSGGPLIDAQGHLIGINTYIRDGQGLGFARPVNLVRQLAANLAVPPSPAPQPTGLQALDGSPSQIVPPPRPVQANPGQWTPGRFMAEAVANVLKNALIVARRASVGFDEDVSILGAYLEPGGQIAFRRQFKAGYQYALLGGGDSDAADVDIVVSDDSGQSIASDRDDDATPMAAFRPEKDSVYVVTVSLERATRGSFCALVSMRQDGYQVPLDNLTTALGNLLKIGAKIHGRFAGEGTGAGFHQGNEQWSLFGTILRNGSSLQLNQLRLERGNHAVIAAADDSAQDIDLYLRSPGGNVVVKNDAPDATPVIAGATSGETYSLVIKDEKSTAPTLVISAILDVVAPSQ